MDTLYVNTMTWKSLSQSPDNKVAMIITEAFGNGGGVLMASTADQGSEDLNFGGLVFNGKVTFNSFFF